MRNSLIEAYSMLDEQSQALAEAHLMYEGSTMRIIELGKRGELAEQGAAHIIQESMAMRGRYHAELESAAHQIREQREQSEAMAEHFRQHGLQLREACTQYVNDRETANREEMKLLKQRLETNSQMMGLTMRWSWNMINTLLHYVMNVWLRWQTAINELTESLSKKEQIIGIKDGIARERYLKIQEMSNENQEKELEHEIEKNDLKHKMHHLKSKNENEISSKEWFEKRFQEEKAEYREFRYNELQQFKDRELGLQSVMDEFKDENVHLIESNTQLRSRDS